MSRERFTRRDALKVIGAGGAAGLAGCTSGGGGGGDLTVGMVYTEAGLGDQGFNDSAKDGMEKAEEELGATVREAEPDDASQYAQFLREYARGDDVDLVCGLSFEMLQAMNTVAGEFPDQEFTIVDAAVDRDNVASYVFKEHEGCYLVGTAAGALTQREFSAGAGRTNTQPSVGFLGGKQNPVIAKFHAGYRAGVRSFDTDIEFKSAYAGTWTNQSKGKSIAESMYNDGVDIVFPAAGGTGLGVFQAAQERNRFAFGVDKEQSRATPQYAPVILGSMVKRVGEAFFRAIRAVDRGSFPAGETETLGLGKNGVNLVYGKQLGSEIPQEVKDRVASARESIKAGDLDIPSTIEY